MALADNPDQKKKPLDANDPRQPKKRLALTTSCRAKLKLLACSTTKRKRCYSKPSTKLLMTQIMPSKQTALQMLMPTLMLTKFLTAKPTNAERNKLFSGAVPKSIQDFENTYKENTTVQLSYMP